MVEAWTLVRWHPANRGNDRERNPNERNDCRLAQAKAQLAPLKDSFSPARRADRRTQDSNFVKGAARDV
jgi:hypothetical protein